jgi:hypothetical protein
MGDEFLPELGEVSGLQMAANVFHEFHEHVRVVDAQHAQAKNFLHVEQMPQIRPGVVLAGVARGSLPRWD